MENNKLLTAEDLVQILSVSRSKAYGLMRRKEVPIVQIGKCVRVRMEDLDEYILTHRVVDSEE